MESWPAISKMLMAMAAPTSDPIAEARIETALRQSCEIYLAAGDGERQEMREFFSGMYSLLDRLWRLSGEYAEKAQKTRSQEALSLAFASLSLENGQTDCRDTYLALSRLREIGERAGLNVAAIEANVARLSSPRMAKLLRTHTLDMRDFM